MFKILCISLFLFVQLQSSSANILPQNNVLSVRQPIPDISSIWVQHIKDFVDLIDIEKVLGVAMGHMSDPEVLNFVAFLLSDDFKKTVWEFESIAEFKEAFKFLGDKGYEVDTIIDFINTALELPPFEKPKVNQKASNGMTGLIEDLITVLPIEEFKKLFKTKLETSTEVAELFETINSPEFMDIMKRMSKNPKFDEFKKKFEGYGFDFVYLCGLAKEIFGEHYQGIFCG